MNWYLLMYLLSVLNGLNFLFVSAAMVSTVGIFVYTMYRFELNEDSRKEAAKIPLANKWIKRFVTCFIVFSILAVFVPTKKDVLMIIAGGAVGEFVTNNEDANEIPSELMKLLRHEINNNIDKEEEL